MKNHKLHLNLSFKEKYLIYWGQAESDPGLLSGIGQIGKGAGKAFESLAQLIDVATRGISKGVDLLDFGIDKIEQGVTYLVDKIQDPGQPGDLPEYEELKNIFPKKPQSTGIDKLDKALILQIRLFFLKYKAGQYAEFLKPAIDQLRILESTRNAIKERARKNRGRIKELNELIRKGEETINTGSLLKNDPGRLKLEMELRGYRSEKTQLEQDSSFVVLWPKPQFQKTEFPPGSGEYIDRLIFDKKQKVKIDLNILYRWAEIYTSSYKTTFEIYEKEMQKLAYHSEKLQKEVYEANKKEPIPDLKDARKKLRAEIASYRGMGEAAEGRTPGSLRIQGNPTDVLQLAGAIKNTVPKSVQPIRPRPNFRIEDIRNLLP